MAKSNEAGYLPELALTPAEAAQAGTVSRHDHQADGGEDE
jgi:hypothetical protein